MKLLCDEMLAGLGRWLRAAGHDAAIAAPGTDDRALVALAEQEDRLLLTRDRPLAAAARARIGVRLLEPGTTDAQARLLRQALGLDWLLAPFTRCMLDNAPLVAAGPGLAASAPTRQQAGPLRACPVCARVYWPGSHVLRMTATLERWQASGTAG